MKKFIKYIRWTARTLAVLLGGGFIILIISLSIGAYLEGKNEPIQPKDMIQLSLGVMGCMSMLLAWKWELIGGTISVLCYTVLGFINPNTFPLIQSLFMPAGILFILVSISEKYLDRKIHLTQKI